VCKIGIVGFGVVGKSALRFLLSHKNIVFKHLFGEKNTRFLSLVVSVWDHKKIDFEDCLMIRRAGGVNIDSSKINLHEFITSQDFVISSPGINLNDYSLDDKKILCELDLFSMFFKKKVVAITGSLGKTTIAKLITKLISVADLSSPPPLAIAAGNIGLPMLDILPEKFKCDVVVLELSSFQLERSKHFAANLVIWNNFYPNHFDRHTTLENYFDAKWAILKNLEYNQNALFSMQLFTGKCGDLMKRRILSVQAKLNFVSDEPLENVLSSVVFLKNFSIISPSRHSSGQDKMNVNFLVFTVFLNGNIVKQDNIFNLTLLPKITFRENWFFVLSSLYLLGANLKELEKMFALDEGGGENFGLEQQQHRLEKFVSWNNVDFYNDSKATIVEATRKAVDVLVKKNRPVIVILGGLSKGVDRSSLLDELKQMFHVKKIYGLGSDNALMKKVHKHFVCLSDLVDEVFSIVEAEDQVLFSPSGSSFDLFDDYQHRGNVFKELVLENISRL
jgi:UDP-N-acetylmuramoylalanine--D-glutamate ligase